MFQIGSHYNCYKLFGFDILYDEDLKPWLIEVNNIPSLFTNPVDSHVNRPMVREMFNIAGFHVPSNIACKHNKAVVRTLQLEQFGIRNISYDEQLYSKRKLDEEVVKEKNCGSDDDILASLTPADVRSLIKAEEELNQTKHWSRLVPSSDPPDHHPRSYQDCLLQAWESRYGGTKERREEGRDMLRKMCSDKYHLKVQRSKGSRTVSKQDKQTENTEENFDKRDWLRIGMFQKFQ